MSAVVSTRMRLSNPQALVALSLVLAVVLIAYRDTTAAMVSIWSRSDTFAHAFLVPPIALWLIWRRRAELAYVETRPNGWMLLSIAVVAFGWLLGDLASVNALTQFAMTGLLVLAVPAVLGWRVARVILFPLAFLFLAVPFGEFLLPQLMDWTADFTVVALRGSGIPVFREGNNFVIPSGAWSVVEACSGVRYLLASLMVGTLFAYLNYQSTRRRWVFVALSVVIPIVANWIRAYLIVLLGHLSGNKIAVGVDHLVYGWVFFGVIVALMYGVGILWREPEAAISTRTIAGPGAPTRTPRTRAFWATAISACIVLVMPHLLLHSIGRVSTGPPPELVRLDGLSGGWQPSTRPLTGWRPSFERPSAEANWHFSSHEGDVGVYIGYYRQQNYDRKLVSSNNQLVRSEDPLWTRAGQPGRDSIEVAQEVLTVVSVVLHGTEAPGLPEKRLRVWQVYWVADRLTPSDAWAKVLAVEDRLLGRGDDAAAIVLYAVEDRSGDARPTLEAFARTNLPAIIAQLRTNRDGAHVKMVTNTVPLPSRTVPE